VQLSDEVPANAPLDILNAVKDLPPQRHDRQRPRPGPRHAFRQPM
jgi:hypothetical protein